MGTGPAAELPPCRGRHCAGRCYEEVTRSAWMARYLTRVCSVIAPMVTRMIPIRPPSFFWTSMAFSSCSCDNFLVLQEYFTQQRSCHGVPPQLVISLNDEYRSRLLNNQQSSVSRRSRAGSGGPAPTCSSPACNEDAILLFFAISPIELYTPAGDAGKVGGAQRRGLGDLRKQHRYVEDVRLELHEEPVLGGAAVDAELLNGLARCPPASPRSGPATGALSISAPP